MKHWNAPCCGVPSSEYKTKVIYQATVKENGIK